ncbi:MAG: hypothetical protein WC551_00620 [Patescibacteria group bacterium]
MPLFKKKTPQTSPTTELLVALAILLTVGLFVLYIKIDLDTGTQQAGLAVVSQQIDQLQRRVIKSEAAGKTAPSTVTQSVTVQAPAFDTSSWKDFSSADFLLKYPANFKVELPSASFKATVVRGTNARVEIFKMKDFGGDRPFGFEPDSGPVNQHQLDGYVPKQAVTATGTRGTYDVWLYYGQDDAAAKAEVQAIYESIKVK